MHYNPYLRIAAARPAASGNLNRLLKGIYRFDILYEGYRPFKEQTAAITEWLQQIEVILNSALGFIDIKDIIDSIMSSPANIIYLRSNRAICESLIRKLKRRIDQLVDIYNALYRPTLPLPKSETDYKEILFRAGIFPMLEPGVMIFAQQALVELVTALARLDRVCKGTDISPEVTPRPASPLPGALPAVTTTGPIANYF